MNMDKFQAKLDSIQSMAYGRGYNTGYADALKQIAQATYAEAKALFVEGNLDQAKSVLHVSEFVLSLRKA